MREVSELIRAAAQDKKSARMVAKAIIDPSRTFFATATDDDPYDGGDYSIPTDTPVGQCTCYSPTQGKAVTFIADPSTGALYSMVQGSSGKNGLGITADKDTKPAVWHRDNGTAYLWYCDSGGTLKRSTVNMTSWGVSGTTTITVDYLPEEWTVVAGSPHAISETQIVYVYLTSIGGLGVGYHDGSRFYHWERRFMSPNVLTIRDWSIYSTATQLENRIFVYSTDLDTGEVRGVRYQPYKKKWSDSFTALPADLSRFDVGNAVQSGGFIHMAGQFHRTDDLADAKVYSLVLRSRDGFTFSWDRFTMLSSLGYQFQIGLDQGAKKVYASDRNTVGVPDMSHFFTAIPNGRAEIGPPGDILSFTVSGPSSAGMMLKGYDEAFLDHATIKKGSKLQAYVGFLADGEYRWVKYQTYIIDAFNEGFASGARDISIGLQDMGSWMTSQLAFPFYSELISKATQYDDCDERDRMYPVQTADKDMFSFMYLDFWNNEEWDGDDIVTGVPFNFSTDAGPGCDYRSFTNDQGATDQLMMKTCDMKGQAFLSAYPVVGTLDVVAKLYGWERTSTDSRPNSNWKIYAVTAPSDDLDNKSVVLGTMTSDYQKFPNPEFTESGSYPIEYTWDSLTEDDLLLYFGFTIQNSISGTSTANPERMEVEGLSFVYDQLKTASGWDLNNPDPATYSRKYLRMPSTGLPNVQFVTKPYTAFRFTMAADFIYDAGDEPLNKGKIGWGVVGIAKNGQDYILGRWLKGSAAIQIVSMRNGEETILAVKSLSPAPEGVMMDHRDGLIRIWYRAASSTSWSGPYLEHQWDEVTDGIMSTSSTGIMHMGIYGAVNPPGFLCSSFNPGDADGVCMIASSDDSVITNFDASGKVAINGIKYTYDGKTPITGDYIGPYQGRQTWNYKRHEDSSIFGGGWGHEHGAFFPGRAYDDMKDLLLGADNGHTWLIDKGSDWTVTHSTGGVQHQLLNRARHYGSNIQGANSIGTDNRTHIGPGLTGMNREGSTDLRLHPYGALVSIYGTDQIWAQGVVSTMVDRDATVKDMLAQLCNAASTETDFPGDWYDATESIGATPVQLAATETLFPGGFDLYFVMPQISDGHSVTVYGSNIFIYDEEDPPVETAFVVEISIKRSGGILQVISHPTGGTRLEDVIINTDVLQAGTHAVRMLFHGEFCSVYLDRTSVATFAYGEDDLKWPTADVNLMMKCSATYDIDEILVCELFDWREAIYVESELTAASALGSVMQERPIEMAPTVDGGMSFSYNIERDTLTYSNAQTKNTFRSHQRVDRTVGDAGSDAIVYFADIGFVSHQAFADEEGFLTRVFKLSTLDTGAGTAAYIMLEKAYESQFQHNITMRPDPRIEVGDRMEIHYLVPGTDTQRDYALIVENIGIGIDEGRYMMSVSGREDELT